MKKNKRYHSGVLERFIPISLELLITDLLSSNLLSGQQNTAFKQFCIGYTALFHAQSHSKLQHLTQLYQPFNPDGDILIPSEMANNETVSSLKSELYAVLEKANYEQISEDDINEALNKISPYGVKVSVDFDDFSEVALFYRGSAVKTEMHRNWKKLSLKKRPTDILIYRRLFILLQPKNKKQWIEYFSKNKNMSLMKAGKKADAALKESGLNGQENVVFLKLFKDIPCADLEMLFPNTKVKMRLFDKIKLAVTGGGGTAGGIMATLGKFTATIDPLSAAIAILGLLGVIWRQIAKVFSQRAKYSAILTKNLYFFTLDNNMGAITYLLNSAEQEECKEAILAYFFLLSSGTDDRIELDKYIETYIQQQYEIPMDFDVDDGLRKLKNYGLVSYNKETIKVEPLESANIKLQQQWQEFINHTTPNQ